jgi:hypothetical protein
LEHAVTIEDYKAISMNLMHSSMEITDQYYSNISDSTIQSRIDQLGQGGEIKAESENKIFQELEEFLKRKNNNR